MKIVIFAGGIGTRLWPLSRENSPKQFDKIFFGKSTIQLAVERVAKTFGIENIFIQTVERYRDIIKDQIPELPTKNIFIEPFRKDLGAAVCMSVIKLKEAGHEGPMAILWADHLMNKPKDFVKAINSGKELINMDRNRFVFMAEKPRFANNNLGWIDVGERIDEINGDDYYSFRGWKYRPPQDECNEMFGSGKFFWNPGYFITSIEFLHEQYQKLAPKIYDCVSNGRYDEAPVEHFDTAIIEKVDLSNAVVLKTDMGWSDPGTLYALKEALEKSKDENVTQGKVVHIDTSDCLLFNMEKKKLIGLVGLNGMVVVNTEDALIVVPKSEVVKVTKLLSKIKEEGHHDHL